MTTATRPYGKTVEPQLGLESFSCPHCGALAHQHWFKVFIKEFGDGKPTVYSVEHIDKKKLEKIPRRGRSQEISRLRRETGDEPSHVHVSSGL